VNSPRSQSSQEEDSSDDDSGKKKHHGGKKSDKKKKSKSDKKAPRRKPVPDWIQTFAKYRTRLMNTNIDELRALNGKYISDYSLLDIIAGKKQDAYAGDGKYYHHAQILKEVAEERCPGLQIAGFTDENKERGNYKVNVPAVRNYDEGPNQNVIFVGRPHGFLPDGDRRKPSAFGLKPKVEMTYRK
jgi:hypothetical protein